MIASAVTSQRRRHNVCARFFRRNWYEELPPEALKTLATAFADNITEELAKQNLSHADVSWYAAPRRLAVRVNQLALQQQEQSSGKTWSGFGCRF